MRDHIIVNLDRCVGCYACEIACKQENLLPAGKKWVEVKQIGPAEAGGKTLMALFPVMNRGCTLCSQRAAGPACVEACPTKALKQCDAAEALHFLYDESRHQLCRTP
ncbi:MAG: 4Fe-4S binding protein [Candidatus Bathyarchaeota archaeon]|nr:4Fe-4S binding protein [Candidatus Bathyarchaeota archaeon]